MQAPGNIEPTTGYVDIVRYFRDVGDDTLLPFGRRLRRILRSDPPLTWSSLLSTDVHALILLAPSGAGKTAELEHEAARCRARGGSALYCQAAVVSTDGFERSIAAHDVAHLDAWAPGAPRPCVFVDAVDETYLRQREFADVLRELARSPALGEGDCLFVFSARNGVWSRRFARELDGFLRGRGIDEPRKRIVTFEPLDLEALRTLVEAHGVGDPDALLRAYEAEEMDTLLDLRPRDVRLLVGRWNKHGRFGRWSAALKEFVDTSFDDEEYARYRPQRLAPADGWQALERIAAATVMMKIPHVAAPTAHVPAGAINARRLFNEWPAPMLSELFENPLFVHKGPEAEAVQLPQGGITHLLASRWFAKRARTGWPTDAIREALLVRIFDEDRYRIPASRRELIGWVASKVSDLRKLLLEDYPQVVLYEGDPDQLPDQEVQVALKHLVRLVKDDDQHEGWRSESRLRRLARPSIEPTVAELLSQSDVMSREACRHLLAWATNGRYASCVSWALQRALNVDEEPSLRAGAIDLVAAAGESADCESLNTLADDASESVRGALLGALVPRYLSGQPLVDFLTKGGDLAFCETLREVVERIGGDDSARALATLSAALATGVRDGTTQGKLSVALVLASAHLMSEDTVCDDAIDVLAAVERLSDSVDIYLPKRETRLIDRALAVDDDARQRLWEKRFQNVAERAADVQHILNPSYGEIQAADVGWLAARHQRAHDAQDGAALRNVWLPLTRALSMLDKEPQAGTSGAPVLDLPTSVLETLAAQQRARAESERKQQQWKQREQQKLARLRKKHTTDLGPHREAITHGDDLNRLAWARDQMHTSGTVWARTDLASLRALVGEEWTTIFVTGLKRCWRKQGVPLPEPGGDTPPVCVVGLTGLALEVRDGLDLATLSPAEATLAARYALHELNAFPGWFPDLLLAHPEPVTQTLAELVRQEWSSDANQLPVLRFAAYSAPHVAATMRKLVIEKLRATGPAHPRTIHYVVNALLTSNESAQRIAACVEREVNNSRDSTDGLCEWLRAWMHFDPQRAADWIEQALEQDAAGSMPILLNTAQLVEKDFHDLAGFTVHTALMAPLALARWARLLLVHVPPENDVRYVGRYSPEPRDHAQGLRNRCLHRLAQDVSPEAHRLLRQLAAEPSMARYSDAVSRMLKEQCDSAAEAAATLWSEDDIVSVERGDEKRPGTIEELFALVQRHITHVARLVENDDFSYRGIFSPSTKEREIQLWLASCLRERSRDLYSVVRENVVDDDKEVDISVFAPGAGSIPIEIKPLNAQRYSFDQLKQTIDDQLLGRYMQPPDRPYGILIVVQHEKKSWRIDGEEVDFRGLRPLLQDRARRAGTTLAKDVRVLAIDLLPRPGQKQPRERAPGPPSDARASGDGSGKRR